jgi:alkylation response protein AidB-like acyl-CoA dehydrogenase
MPFAAKPIIGGDAFDQACRIGLEADGELAQMPDTGDQAACLRRHWDTIVALGWITTAIREDAGGAGGELSDLAALVAGAGRGGLPLPVAACCGVLPHLLADQTEILSAHAEGRFRLALIPAEAARDDEADVLRVVDGRLTGAAVGIEAPPDPTHALIIVADALLLVPADAMGVTVTRYQRIDGRPATDWRFTASTFDVLARGDSVLRRAAEARDIGALLTCVESVSAAGALLEQSIDYLLNRVQFGVPLATHQALRHRVAEMYVEYENLRGLVTQALRSTAAGAADAWRDVAFAKLRLGEAGRFIAQSAIQCHGGMGMTEGLQAIRLARRIMMAEFEYGDRSVQAKRLLATAA